MTGLQELIYKLEEGSGVKGLRVVMALVALAALAVFYDLRCYRNFNSQEAMDGAQLARNLSEGRGYSTDFIRPLSLHLVKTHREDKSPMLRAPAEHPDLANPPVYPLLLAGLMKVAPFDFEVKDAKKDTFSVYQPEILIAIFNQVLFLAAILMLFFLARRLFDSAVAWIAAAVFALNEVFWRFSISGQSTMLLMVIFLALAWVVVLLDQGENNEEEKASPLRLLVLSLLAGLILGVGTLTRYSFGFLVIPVAVFILVYSPRIRWSGAGAVVLVFLLVVTPWCIRNARLSGNPFGIAGYAALSGTSTLPGDTLERSLDVSMVRGDEGKADFAKEFSTGFKEIRRKLVVNLRDVAQNDLPRLGSSWAVAFFLPGLLLPFVSRTLVRLRFFVLGGLALFAVVQAVGRTHLSADSPDINSENLLVLFVPLVVMFGAAFFMVLLDQMVLPFPQLRTASMALFVMLACLPLGFTLLPPAQIPVAYPPYYPPVIAQVGKWMGPKELTMSDVAWAVAWYGKRKAVALSLDTKENFYAISDEMKTIDAVYITPRTLDQAFQSTMVKSPKKSWGAFVAEVFMSKQVPTGFPLKKLPPGFLFEQILLTDWERWVKEPKQ
jgi:hypothetical protein